MIRKLILSLCVGFCCLACEEALPDYNTTWSGVQFVLGQTLNPERFSYSYPLKSTPARYHDNDTNYKYIQPPLHPLCIWE